MPERHGRAVAMGRARSRRPRGYSFKLTWSIRRPRTVRHAAGEPRRRMRPREPPEAQGTCQRALSMRLILFIIYVLGRADPGVK